MAMKEAKRQLSFSKALVCFDPKLPIKLDTYAQA